MHGGQEGRLERIENMLTKLIQAQGPQPQTSVGLDDLAMPLFGGDLNPDLSSFWDNMQLLTPPELPALEYSSQRLPDKNGGDVKESLVALLPSQQDATTIVANTTAWLWGLRSSPGSILRPNEPIPDLDMAAISNGSSMNLAKALLYLALYMQQLPPDFNIHCLQFSDVGATIEGYVSTVNSLVLSKEDMVCSADGLECLHMLGMIYINEGAIRKAWLSFRRALDVAKMKGFRDSYAGSAQQTQSDELAARRRMWLSTIAADCFLSLLLGLESVLGSQPFGAEKDSWDESVEDVDANFDRRFYLIVARLAQKNFLGQQHDYKSAREMDQDLDNLWDSMPSTWQRTPTLRPGRSLESAKDYSRLMCHLSFFQIRIFVHLPFAFLDHETSNSESSRDKCLEAARIILQWYLGLQQEGKGHPRCKIMDITAFLAAVTILLAEVDHGSHSAAKSSRRRAYSSDTALVEQFIHAMEALGMSCGREHIAEQGARALSAILAASRKLDGPVLPDTDRSEDASTPTHDFITQHQRTGLEDMLASSFRKALDADSTAARVFDLAFSQSTGH
jgi:hypothetical protein